MERIDVAQASIVQTWCREGERVGVLASKVMISTMPAQLMRSLWLLVSSTLEGPRQRRAKWCPWITLRAEASCTT